MTTLFQVNINDFAPLEGTLDIFCDIKSTIKGSYKWLDSYPTQKIGKNQMRVLRK